MKVRNPSFFLCAIFVLSLIGCGQNPQATPSPSRDSAKPISTHSLNAAPSYKEVRIGIARIWRASEAAYATATPVSDERGYEKQLDDYAGKLKGKKVEAWQGWVLQTHEGTQGTYTITVDMDEYYEVDPPLGFEYRGIRLIGLADV